ncbi:MmpS family transport accessory protein [Flavobacterium sp. HNIBRBA15423]|uniref:MmpS family transport accessory protein n=1 Tax=Flavobacterium sp. HNIBRBA15423 TaxID=3458683 RepID=UPI0040447BCB
MKSILKKTIPLLIICLLFASCSSDDSKKDDLTSNSKDVKYELTGNYSGTLLIVYTNSDGANQIEDNVSLPWSKEITINKTEAVAIGLTAGSEVGGSGLSGQTLTGKIFIGNELKKSATVNTTSSGYINLSGLTYVLQ